MDNSRKNDSIATKTHRSTSEQQEMQPAEDYSVQDQAANAANGAQIPPPQTPPASSATTLATAMAPPAAAAASLNLASSSSSSKTVQRPAVFDKLEALVQDMQDKVHGVPVRHQKVFLTSIPFAFMGYDLIEWLMDRLSIEDSLEAVHLANLLCQFGYYFPIGELRNLLVKDDSSLYRFQSPYYWPSQHHTPDNIEYAIYLAKRSQQRKREKHGLEDFEVEAYNNLKKILFNKWEFVSMQAEEQLKVAKDRKKDDKHIVESQERAYWRVYRPPPGYTTVVESSPVPTREHRVKARNRTKEHIQEEVKFLREYVSISRCKVSFVAENLIDYTDTFLEYDPMLCQPGPSNPWITDDQTHWILNQPIVDTPTEKRVRKWELSLEDLVQDPLGVKELMEYMKKEYSHENLRFWLSVQELRYGPGTEAKIKKKVKEIWDEFLAPGAKAEINIDGKTMEATKQAMKSPSRFTFEVAAGHVYILLLKKDCYPRFIRSENYKSILANAINPGNVRRRIFNFPKVPKRQQKSGASAGPVAGSNTASGGRVLEDFNVYGIHGAGAGGDISDSPPDGPDDPSFPNAARNDEADNICPWELDDIKSNKEEPAKKPTHVRRGSDPTNVKSASSTTGAKARIVHPSETAAAVAAAVTTPLETVKSGSGASIATATVVTKRASSTSGSDGHATADPITSGSRGSPHERHRHSENSASAAGGQSHHHHHHHHHHHAASRRVKNRSRKKKPSRAASSATSTDNDNATVTTGKSHDPPTHQHSAASLLSSVAAASVAMASMDSQPSKAPTTASQPPNKVPAATQNTTASTSLSTSTATVTTTTTTTAEPVQPMETKCTQTKLDDEEPLFLLPPPAQPVTTTSKTENEAEASAEPPVPLEAGAETLAQPPAAATTTAESKGEIGTWTSSTEVCPWEDEENQRESHAPFVKTYATLGYL